MYSTAQLTKIVIVTLKHSRKEVTRWLKPWRIFSMLFNKTLMNINPLALELDI